MERINAAIVKLQKAHSVSLEERALMGYSTLSSVLSTVESDAFDTIDPEVEFESVFARDSWWNRMYYKPKEGISIPSYIRVDGLTRVWDFNNMILNEEQWSSFHGSMSFTTNSGRYHVTDKHEENLSIVNFTRRMDSLPFELQWEDRSLMSTLYLCHNLNLIVVADLLHHEAYNTLSKEFRDDMEIYLVNLRQWPVGLIMFQQFVAYKSCVTVGTLLALFDKVQHISDSPLSVLERAKVYTPHLKRLVRKIPRKALTPEQYKAEIAKVINNFVKRTTASV